MEHLSVELFTDVYEIAEKLSNAITKYGKKKVLIIIEKILLNDRIKIISKLLETIQEYFKIDDKKLILRPLPKNELLFIARNIFVTMMYHHFKLSQKEIAMILKIKPQSINQIINSLSSKDRLNPYLYKKFFIHYDEILKLTLKKIENNGTNEQSNSPQ